jgi:hypothetical protein
MGDCMTKMYVIMEGVGNVMCVFFLCIIFITHSYRSIIVVHPPWGYVQKYLDLMLFY